jgi:glycine cleavage system aminomethyltransferase T
VQRLAKYVIADDVQLTDLSPGLTRLGLEGPAAPRIAAAAGPALAAAGAVQAEFGWSGESAVQLFVPAAAADALAAALRAAGAPHGRSTPTSRRSSCCASRRASQARRRAGRGGAAARGAPRRGRVHHRAAHRAGGDRAHPQSRPGQAPAGRAAFRRREPPEPATPIEVDGRRVGEVTSAARSPQA